MCKTRTINIWGGPGSGKSTTASALYTLMKCSGYSVELVEEQSRRLIRDGSANLFKTPGYSAALQFAAIYNAGPFEYVICDAPVLSKLAYENPSKEVEDYIRYLDELLPGYDVFLERSRSHRYEPIGRIHTEDEARKLDIKMKSLIHYSSRAYFLCRDRPGLQAAAFILRSLGLAYDER